MQKKNVWRYVFNARPFKSFTEIHTKWKLDENGGFFTYLRSERRILAVYENRFSVWTWVRPPIPVFTRLGPGSLKLNNELFRFLPPVVTWSYRCKIQPWNPDRCPSTYFNVLTIWRLRGVTCYILQTCLYILLYVSTRCLFSNNYRSNSSMAVIRISAFTSRNLYTG